MKFGKTLKSIILCIRFPFLYPRNRFTGKHYNNWKLIEKQKKLIEKCYKYAYKHKEKYLKKFGYKCTLIDGKYINHKYVMKLVPMKYKILNYYYNFITHILSIIHCIPTYNELDHMDKGWRKAFGIQMCKEIKKELIKHKYLFKYRITDIKEKWGELRWYDAGAPKSVYEIIDKYTELSQRTCIMCGKSAKYITKGWISPYCEDCVDWTRGNFESIDKYYNSKN